MLHCNWTNINCSSHTAQAPLDYTENWNCKLGNTCSTVANGDITGSGVYLPYRKAYHLSQSLTSNQVLIAFLTTTCLTFVVAWILLLFDILQDVLPTEPEYRTCVLDQRFQKAIWRILRYSSIPQLPRLYRRFCRNMIVVSGNVHLATGIAILIAGYVQSCSLTIYHFHAVVYLAWMSSSTHMLTLIMSRYHLHEHNYLLYWRLACMSILFVLLATAICLTGSPRWDTAVYGNSLTFDTHVVCLWNRKDLKNLGGDATVSLVLLGFGYLARLTKLLKGASAFASLWFVKKPELLMRETFTRCMSHRNKTQSKTRRLLWNVMLWMILACYLYGRTFRDIYESVLGELVWATLSLLYGAASVLSWRSISPLTLYEANWTYGQSLAIALLLSPLLSAPETFNQCKKDILHTASPSVPVLAVTVDDQDDLRELRNQPWTELFADQRTAYYSIAYHCQVIIIFVLILSGFILVAVYKLSGYISVVLEVLMLANDSLTFAAYFLPFIVTPFVTWFVLMAPWSRVIRRTIGSR